MVVKIFFTLLLFFTQTLSQTGANPKIAVIGGGIGGTSVGYFLSKRFSGAKIVNYDRGDHHLGGRLRTVSVGPRQYEVGGSIIHSENKYMMEFLNICPDLKKKAETPDEPFTLHKDGQIAFQEWGYSFLDKARMGLRYGVESALKLEYFVDNLLKSFTGVYEKLDNPETYYKTVKDFLLALSPVSKEGEKSTEMYDLTKITLKEKLLSLGIDELMIDELVTVAARVNYGQMPDTLHAFVGSVGLAGMDGSLWAIQGGNNRAASCASMLSRARGYRGNVTEIRTQGEEFVVRVEFNGAPAKEETYDAVVIATPLTSDVSSIQLPSDVDYNFPGKYHTTVATIVKGSLNPEAIGFKDGASFTTSNFYVSPDSNIVSIAKLTPVDYNPDADGDTDFKVFKIFSKRALSSEELSEMFSDIEFTESVPWLAYPDYTTNDDHSTFELSPGLYYLNRMEWAASAMEMSVISAKNVANMASQFLLKSINKKVEL